MKPWSSSGSKTDPRPWSKEEIRGSRTREKEITSENHLAHSIQGNPYKPTFHSPSRLCWGKGGWNEKLIVSCYLTQILRQKKRTKESFRQKMWKMTIINNVNSSLQDFHQLAEVASHCQVTKAINTPKKPDWCQKNKCRTHQHQELQLEYIQNVQTWKGLKSSWSFLVGGKHLKLHSWEEESSLQNS